MKFFYIVVLVFSYPALAIWNEIECTGSIDAKKLTVEVENNYAGSIFRAALLTVKENENTETFDYSVTTKRPGGFNKILYSAYGFRLEVDLFSHQVPRYGWTYKGSLESKALNDQYIQGLECRFPNTR